MERDFRQTAQSWLDGNYDEQTKNEVRELMKEQMEAQKLRDTIAAKVGRDIVR